MLWVGLQYVNVAFPGLTQLLFCNLLGSFTFILQFSDFYQWYITINMQDHIVMMIILLYSAAVLIETILLVNYLRLRLV